jgi:hypothetical protein
VDTSALGSFALYVHGVGPYGVFGFSSQIDVNVVTCSVHNMLDTVDNSAIIELEYSSAYNYLFDVFTCDDPFTALCCQSITYTISKVVSYPATAWSSSNFTTPVWDPSQSKMSTTVLDTTTSGFYNFSVVGFDGSSLS